MGGDYVDDLRLKDIIIRRLLRVPSSMKKNLPSILYRHGSTFYAFKTKDYFMLIFVDSKEKNRIIDMQSKNYNPFPALIKPNDVLGGSAFRFEKAKNVYIEQNRVDNAYALSLGKDCSIVLRDFFQRAKTKNTFYEYSVDLAYIVSFGDEINNENYYDYIEDLIVFSLNYWQGQRGHNG